MSMIEIEFEFLSVTWLIPVYTLVLVWLRFENEFELEKGFENVQWYCTSVLVVLYNESEDSL